ncbi:MAG TPA: hypothetical protein VFE47_24600 [Tepidisphaeraceae bacterium]|jgi:hypothetical protein|nr:hypothetical protein [Tepidisphaeraceae bacterium]
MPLSINVGLSRKASRDYQSTGVSINVTAELNQSLLANPDALQAQVADLYAQAQSALEQQASVMNQPKTPLRQDYQQRPAPRSNGNNANGNGAYGDNRQGGGERNGYGKGSSMTDNQRRAIAAIARRLNVDPALEARDVLGAELNHLSLLQASDLIDHLKSIQSDGEGR